MTCMKLLSSSIHRRIHKDLISRFKSTYGLLKSLTKFSAHPSGSCRAMWLSPQAQKNKDVMLAVTNTHSAFARFLFGMNCWLRQHTSGETFQNISRCQLVILIHRSALITHPFPQLIPSTHLNNVGYMNTCLHEIFLH